MEIKSNVQYLMEIKSNVVRYQYLMEINSQMWLGIPIPDGD